MIEIKKDETGKKERLFLDKTEITEAAVRSFPVRDNKSDRYYHIKVSGFENANVLSKQKLQEFPLRLTLKFVNWFDLNSFYISLDIDTIAYSRSNPKNFTVNKNVIILKIVPYLISWNFAYSFSEYKLQFNKNWKEDLKQEIEEIDWIFKSKNTQLIIDSLEVTPSLKKTFAVESSEETISKIVSPFFKNLIICHNKTINNLKKTKDEKSLSVLFNFSEELKVPCEQYLLYFAQFLKDLGINATSNLKEEVGEVLFSVTPTDNVEALDKIREALAVYLSLPSSAVLYNDSFQSVQLKQQVENLQHSQRMKEIELRSTQYAFRLAQQTIENQDDIISQQRSVIDNQNKIIEKITDPKIMINSLENKEELEKFCEGFEVGKSEFLIKHFGLHLNPATVLKNVGKKILGKEENKSVLGLDEKNN